MYPGDAAWCPASSWHGLDTPAIPGFIAYRGKRKCARGTLSHSLTQSSQWGSCRAEPNSSPWCSHALPLRVRLAPGMASTLLQYLVSSRTGGRENARAVHSSTHLICNVDYIFNLANCRVRISTNTAKVTLQYPFLINNWTKWLEIVSWQRIFMSLKGITAYGQISPKQQNNFQMQFWQHFWQGIMVLVDGSRRLPVLINSPDS